MNMQTFMLVATGTAELTKLTLVQDLAAVMLVAGIVAALFHLLGWPKVIGYIVAGSLMRMKFFNNLLISNEESINVLANLGIIFLMCIVATILLMADWPGRIIRKESSTQ